MGGGGRLKKSWDGGGVPHVPPLWETLLSTKEKHQSWKRGSINLAIASKFHYSEEMLF